MDVIKTKVMELTENQNHILVAIKFLDERLKEFTEKLTDIEPTGFKDILESLSIIVKNSDDICVMKQDKEESALTIEALEKEIVKLNEEKKS